MARIDTDLLGLIILKSLKKAQGSFVSTRISLKLEKSEPDPALCQDHSQILLQIKTAQMCRESSLSDRVKLALVLVNFCSPADNPEN